MRTSDIKLRLPLHPFYGEIEDMTDSADAMFAGATFSELQYAQRLATILWEKHWKDVDTAHWKPGATIIDVLNQIDNMTAGLVRMDSRAAGQGGMT